MNKMTEEEKRAIKGLEWSQKQMRLGNLPDYDQGHYADIRIVLNLIEKQQKEIEDLKEITKMYDTYMGEEMPLNSRIMIADRDYFDNGTFVKIQ